MAHNINRLQYVYKQNPGLQQTPGGHTYQVPPNSLPCMISVACPNTKGLTITDFKRFLNVSATWEAPQYKSVQQIVND